MTQLKVFFGLSRGDNNMLFEKVLLYAMTDPNTVSIVNLRYK